MIRMEAKMTNDNKTKKQLLEEIGELRQRIAEWESKVTDSGRQREKRLPSTQWPHEVVEEMIDAVVIVNLGGTIRQVNREFERGLGWTKEEVIGKTPLELGIMSEEDGYRVTQEIVPEILAKGFVKDFETLATRKDGTKFPTMQSWTLIKNDEDQPTGILTVAKDITEQKLAERALQETESSLKSIVKATPIGIGMVRDRVLQWANDQMMQMVGYSEAEVIGKSARILYENDEEFERVGNEKYRQIRERGMGEIDTRLVCKDGKIIDVHLRSVCIDPDDLSRGVIFTAMDITERKRAQDALRESEEKYRDIFENVSDFLYFHNLEGYFTESNMAFKTEYGYSEDDLANMNARDLIPERYEHQFEDYLKEIKEKGTATGLMKVMTKDGRERIVEYRNSVVHGSTGAVSVRGSARDITDRKRAEEALRESEERYRTLIEKMRDGFSVLDEKGVVTYANDKLCEMLGYPQEEIIGCPVRQFLDTSNQTLLDEQLGQRKKGGYEPYELVWTREDGQKIHTIMSPTPVFDKEGSFAGSYAVTTDITEKKKLEEQLQQAQKMKAVGTLAGGVAHDFNNLLMAIQGNVALMLFDVDQNHPHHEKLKAIQQYVNSGAELTKQLLGFARGGKYEVKPTDLNELVEKSSEMFGRTKKEIIIHPRYEKAVRIVEVDQSQIEQVLMNLFINAWEAMPKGGELYVQTQNVTLLEDFVTPFPFVPGEYVKISISDTGVGMGEQTIQRIFEPFFTTKERGRGTGLGLASVYGIVKNHGGIVNVQSEEGEGSTFDIYIPAIDAKVEAEKTEFEAQEEVVRGKGTILLVDDEEMITTVGKQLLESMGYEVVVAGSGKEAVEIISNGKNLSTPIDLVILDVVMPDMGGGETYDRIKEISPDLKVLLSSGYSMDGEAKGILEKGCEGFIQKPFTPIKLSHKIKEILDKG